MNSCNNKDHYCPICTCIFYMAW